MTTDTRRRVKLYALNAERQWDDRGTGHVSSTYVDRLKGISLLVRAESDGSLLLESKIQPDTAYQKQQDTLIVWSEGDNFDLALSFQEKAGCDEIWEKICQVQGKDPSVEITQDIVEESEDERFEDMSDTAPPIELPPCELSRLEDISETIQSCLSTPLRKEKLSMALESESYIKKLLNLFHVCEDLDNTEGLHHLFEIFKNIFLLNKNALFEIMFADDTIFDVVGCLEYDPSVAQPKKHRQYLKQWAKFREAVPIKNQDLLAKIHQTFRVQYIQDIILPTPSVFVEDNMLNTLSSFIFFNKVEIVTMIQDDERFLLDVFAVLTDPATGDTKRRDTVLFLKEFCNFAQNLQPQGKDSFYKTLTCLGILQALELTLVMNDKKTKSASIDILTAIVEFSPLVVRNYTLNQANRPEGERVLLNIAIEQMLNDSEPELGIAVQLMGIVKILLEPENMLTEKGDFLNFFYKYSVQTLVAPLMHNTTGDRPQNEDYQTAQLLGIVLDILSFCVEHHSYHIKNFLLQKDLLKRILVLMKSTHTFLVLGALRLLRKIIALKDEFYNRHIVKCNLFAPVVDAFIRNNGRYNLLESAILELFEFIKLEDIRTLCVYFVENFSKIFDEIEYVQTFKYLKNRYDQYQDRLKDRDKMENRTDGGLPIIRSGGRFRRDQRQMEEEEEMWFNEEDDFTEEIDTYNSVMKSVSEKNGPQTQNQQKSSPPHSTSPHTGLLGSLNTTASSTATSASSGAPVASGSSSPESISADEQTQAAVHLAAAANIALQHHQQQQQQQQNPFQQQTQPEIAELQQQLSSVEAPQSQELELSQSAAASVSPTSSSSSLEASTSSSSASSSSSSSSSSSPPGSSAAASLCDSATVAAVAASQFLSTIATAMAASVTAAAATSSSPSLSPAPAVSSPDIESADAQLPPSDDASSPDSGDQDANSTDAGSSEVDKATAKKGLVDYESDSGEDDYEEDEDSEGPQAQKRARLA
ncbi:serine/threonine-protein phosphatase 4 regulatory subunit 3 isoform X1 [Drosophila rhopaloa]|uniref:Serine/threonine-protein phosphatase 4 regulatory subunit 3 isoform X1 n=1 Tax=Drosophila rhopaloa TaxID=1041015 RepID=A0A6P4E8F7_DRORH|nr:serine/threonine-protein phosphatase 4 regulatory subunit 3 isoform X1 [Drosophila rhopaloa]XP_016969726.1 serine/threonine-protein phosphatase 4 regulatory subunit 3 isoform X1 [Drosophila rhopaloa]